MAPRQIAEAELDALSSPIIGRHVPNQVDTLCTVKILYNNDYH